MLEKDILISIQSDLAQIKKAISTPSCPTVSDKWIPRSEVMRFFSYAPTQMGALEKSGELVVAKVGKRKFVLRESLERLLDSNITNTSNT